MSAHALRPQIEIRGAREIEEARDERVEPVHLGGNVARQLARKRLRVLQFLLQHFRRAFDHAERIADFVREARRKLAERCQALGAARVGLGALQLAVRFFEELGERLIARDLAAIVHTKRFTSIAARKKKRMRIARTGPSASGVSSYCREPESGTSNTRARRARSRKACRGAKINGRGEDRKKINRIVVAVDPDFAGVGEQQGGESDLQTRRCRCARVARHSRDERAFENWKDCDNEKNELLMEFVNAAGGTRGRRSTAARRRRSNRSAIFCGRASRDMLPRSPGEWIPNPRRI